MLSYQRYYTFVTLLLFIVLNAVYFFSDSESVSIETKQVSLPKNAIISKFITQNLAFDQSEKPTILELNFNEKPTAAGSIIEIAETNVHSVSLIVNDGKFLKSFNWFKCNPLEQDNLSHNPNFKLDLIMLDRPIYLVYSKSSINPINVKFYSVNNFFNKQATQGVIGTILVLIILFILIVAFSIYLKVKNEYNSLFSIYIFLSLISHLVFNGFTNNFWPFNIHYVADHILCSLLALHVSIMCYFLILLVNRSLVSKRRITLINFIFVCSIITFFLTLIWDSYLMISYLIFLITVSSCAFLSSYPKIFERFKEKEAYKLNFSGILLLTLVFLVHSLKYLGLLKANFLLDTSLKMLYVGHIIFVFGAFILINKKKVVQLYLKKNQPAVAREFVHGTQNISEVLATLTNREMEVLEFLAKGYTDKNLADQLFVSVATIKTHKQRIYKKLGIHNRVQATKIYTEFDSLQINFINNSSTVS